MIINYYWWIIISFCTFFLFTLIPSNIYNIVNQKAGVYLFVLLLYYRRRRCPTRTNQSNYCEERVSSRRTRTLWEHCPFTSAQTSTSWHRRIPIIASPYPIPLFILSFILVSINGNKQKQKAKTKQQEKKHKKKLYTTDCDRTHLYNY